MHSQNGRWRSATFAYKSMQLSLLLDTVSKEAVYIAVGIRKDGSKEVLTYTIAPTESAFVWNKLLQDVRARGTEEVLLFISDGLTGIASAIEQIYAKTILQTCCVHGVIFVLIKHVQNYKRCSPLRINAFLYKRSLFSFAHNY